jgi:hypothetical protein
MSIKRATPVRKSGCLKKMVRKKLKRRMNILVLGSSL